jgi:hypothetical protein
MFKAEKIEIMIAVLIGKPNSNWKIDDQKKELKISNIKNTKVEIINILFKSCPNIESF